MSSLSSMPHLHQSSTSHTSGSRLAQATMTTTEASTASTDEHSSSSFSSTRSTVLVLLLFFLPLITAFLSQLPWALRVPLITAILVSAAIFMALLIAHIYTTTMFERFRHPAGVLFQFLGYNIIIMAYSIAIWPGPGTASTDVIGWALVILPKDCLSYDYIAQAVFWAIVAYRCSEERLGLYAHVQGGVQAGLWAGCIGLENSFSFLVQQDGIATKTYLQAVGPPRGQAEI
ncbi:hypothetical protein P692DRAFT_20953230 [Suillus brevipes Sb2]|nr:hypothetical protein P692DRAFT_20953230 [Suillus brevipes Sb2]